MKVWELISKLHDYNQDAEVHVVVHNHQEEFSIAHGSSEGCTKENAECVDMYVDKLCGKERS